MYDSKDLWTERTFSERTYGLSHDANLFVIRVLRQNEVFFWRKQKLKDKCKDKTNKNPYPVAETGKGEKPVVESQYMGGGFP